MARLSASLAPLQLSNFRAIWLDSVSSNFGGLIQSVGAAWLMTYYAISHAGLHMIAVAIRHPTSRSSKCPHRV